MEAVRKRGLVSAWNSEKNGGTISVSVAEHFYVNRKWIVSAPAGCFNPIGLVAEFDAIVPNDPEGLRRAINVTLSQATGLDALGGAL